MFLLATRRRADPDGSSLPTPSALGFAPGDLVGCVSGELGLRGFLEAAGHSLVVTDDTDGVGSFFDCELHDADFIVTPPNCSAYLDRRRLQLARQLKAVITAGVGSDHVDLEAAMELGIDVAEVTYSSSVSVAEHTVLTVQRRRERIALPRFVAVTAALRAPQQLPTGSPRAPARDRRSRRSLRSCATSSLRTRSRATAAGASQTSPRAPLIWKACTWARSRLAASASR